MTAPEAPDSGESAVGAPSRDATRDLAGRIWQACYALSDPAIGIRVVNQHIEKAVTERLRKVHDLMDDRGMCPYYRREETGQDPQGICSFGCRDEPSCMTDHGGPEFPWASEALREVIADLTPPDRTPGEPT